MYANRGRIRMSENQEVEIRYSIVNGKWRFDAICGKYKLGGIAQSLEEAEKKANFAIKAIPNHGVIHSIYRPGKPVKPVTGTFSDALVSDGFKKAVQEVIEKDSEILERLGSDYDDNGIPYWEKWNKDD